ncbi:phosphatase [Romboutsia weinsteinii]|uniref:Phosphatase n=1 Tax=Romboutsia weinsteinii TaxID=2020949 RepID=A0A371IXI8_9FIRM|nr:phosphatase [Romboutsia weinsteinii]RDY25181.1 phosphatase [Romboutsia weinsteinii]
MKAIIDLHCHTISSGHAYSTLNENINEAVKKGLKYLGISDHACSLPGAPHPFFFHNLHVIPRQVENTKMLRGIEANIIDYDGNIDVEDSVYEKLDYVIASLHSPCIAHGTIEQNTNAILKVMDNPNVKIIGHLDDSRYPVEYESIVKKAKEKNILLEINNSSLSPNSFRQGADKNISTMLKLCKEHGVRVILGSDSHICYTIGVFDNSESALEKEDFPDELVINYNEDQIIEFFKINF